MTVRTAIHRRVPLNALPEFTPVPRKVQRHDGWTPERQKAFIAALADTGCAAIACRMVNMSQPSYSQLRRQPGAESFRAAADAAHTLGLQVVKDEAFHRAMVGELIPVFVGGKLMGFRRKKNDRLLMFILRHYGQDAGGRKTTINYFSTRATAGAANTPLPSGEREGPAAKRWEGEGTAVAASEASTTTVKTVISGNDAPNQRDADEASANVLNAFEGVALDAEAQAEIHRALTACAERRRALADDPENDPERFFIGAEETEGYLGQLESGVEGDWIEHRSGACPEQGRRGEHLWENLGEGGEAERIDQVVAGIEERRAKRTPEEIEAERAEDEAEVQRMREARARPALPVLSEVEGPRPEPDPDDPRADWSNWTSGSYVPPEDPPRNGEGDHAQHGGGAGAVAAGRVEPDAPISPRTGRPLRRYKKRTPKPPFTPPEACPGPRSGETRKAEAVAVVAAERRELADAEAKRRRRRRDAGDGKSAGDSCS
jgi:hypothetical protein